VTTKQTHTQAEVHLPLLPIAVLSDPYKTNTGSPYSRTNSFVCLVKIWRAKTEAISRHPL
jgi:hypothetical protein